jgi:diguanylate cyclase (GGDEF)-like protein/PAS domain S-box-containing protein
MPNTEIWNLNLPSDYELEPIPNSTILVVDDREENIYALKKLLEKLDVNVITANSGIKALELSLRHDFALILLDVQMPVMNGFEVAEFLRENEATAKVPIIFITAISKEDKFVFKGYDSGAVDYVFKPIEPAIIQAKVKIFIELAQQREHLKRNTLVMADLNARHLRILEAMQEGALGINKEGTILFANPAAQKLLKSENKLTGRNILPFLDNKAQEGEWVHSTLYHAITTHNLIHEPHSEMFRADGTSFIAEYNFGPYAPSEGLSGGVIIFNDITTRRALEEKLQHRASYDDLTGIVNRALFMDTLPQAVGRASRSNQPVALFFMDLDGFKPVNDKYGHEAGDFLLKEFSRRCAQIMRVGDVFARIGGDEFVVLLENAPSVESLEKLAKKFCDEADRAFEFKSQLIYISLSIGVAYAANGQVKPDNLLNIADKAMYKAKESGKNCWEIVEINTEATADTAKNTTTNSLPVSSD